MQPKTFNTSNITVEVMERSWYKRREAKETDANITNVEIYGYKPEHNHFCDMYVTYYGCARQKYISRVVYNDINKYWTIDGMHVAVRVL